MRKRADVVGWPRVEGADERISCPYCDCLQVKEPIAEGASASCVNCGEALYQNGSNSLEGAISFSLAALIFLFLGLFFPFLSISELGLRNSINLIGAMGNLWTDGGEAMAVSIGLFAIFLPFWLICSLLYVSVPLLSGRALPGVISVFRGVLFCKTWIMVEVFFVGSIVSLIKLVDLAEIGLGPAFWSVGALMVCLVAAIRHVERYEFWDRIEKALTDQKEGRKP